MTGVAEVTMLRLIIFLLLYDTDVLLLDCPRKICASQQSAVLPLRSTRPADVKQQSVKLE